MNFPSRGAPSVNESLLAGGKAGNVGKGKVGLLGSTANLANAAIGAGYWPLILSQEAPLSHPHAPAAPARTDSHGRAGCWRSRSPTPKPGSCSGHASRFFSLPRWATRCTSSRLPPMPPAARPAARLARTRRSSRPSSGRCALNAPDPGRQLCLPSEPCVLRLRGHPQAAEKAVIWLQVVYLTGCNVCMLIIICDQLKPVRPQPAARPRAPQPLPPPPPQAASLPALVFPAAGAGAPLRREQRGGPVPAGRGGVGRLLPALAHPRHVGLRLAVVRKKLPRLISCLAARCPSLTRWPAAVAIAGWRRSSGYSSR